MKIAVIGGGIVGICTAYELTQDGHEVSVFERNTAVAQEASFACGGHLSASLSHPLAFAEPRTSSRFRALLHSSRISLHKGTSLSDLRWLLGWKTRGHDHLEKLQAAYALASYSLAHQQMLAAQMGLIYECSEGNMLLWDSEAAWDKHLLRLAEMKEFGLVSELLTPDQARAKEPALQADFAFHGASYFPGDAVGNCRQFAHLLKDKLSQSATHLHFGCEVAAISQGKGLQIQTADGASHSFDQLVVCTGGHLPGLMAKAPPLTKVWSHSLTVPVRESLNAPRSAVQDMHQRISVARMGDRVRVTGGAELGANGTHNDQTLKHLYRTLNTLFPGAADYRRSAQVWKGASFFTPDGLPLIGASGAPGIWLNVGHGHNGWSMACGSARIVADLIANKPVELDTAKLAAARFST